MTTNADYIRLTAQVAVLEDVAQKYSGKTIDNIIQQMKSVIDHIKKMNKSRILADGVEYYPDDETLLLIRCPQCGAENYAPAVATGKCIWCGYDARELLNKEDK